MEKQLIRSIEEQILIVDKLNEIIGVQNDIINITNRNAATANHNINVARYVEMLTYFLLVAIILLIFFSHKEIDQKLEKLQKTNTQKTKKIDQV